MVNCPCEQQECENSVSNKNVSNSVSNKSVSKPSNDSDSKQGADESKSTEVAPSPTKPADKENKSSPAKGKDTGKPSKSPAAKPALFSRLLIFLTFLIALAALAGTAYIGWRGMAVENAQRSGLDGQEQLQSQIARQQARLTETIQSLSPVEQQMGDLQQRNDRLLNRIDVLSRQVRELGGTSREGWRLAEVEYLMRLANQKLLMTADVVSAKALLMEADAILVDLDDYSLFAVREALAEDLAELRALCLIWIRKVFT